MADAGTMHTLKMVDGTLRQIKAQDFFNTDLKKPRKNRLMNFSILSQELPDEPSSNASTVSA
jgi:hypothetical protein